VEGWLEARVRFRSITRARVILWPTFLRTAWAERSPINLI